MLLTGLQSAFTPLWCNHPRVKLGASAKGNLSCCVKPKICFWVLATVIPPLNGLWWWKSHATFLSLSFLFCQTEVMCDRLQATSAGQDLEALLQCNAPEKWMVLILLSLLLLFLNSVWLAVGLLQIRSFYYCLHIQWLLQLPNALRCKGHLALCNFEIAVKHLLPLAVPLNSVLFPIRRVVEWI